MARLWDASPSRRSDLPLLFVALRERARLVQVPALHRLVHGAGEDCSGAAGAGTRGRNPGAAPHRLAMRLHVRELGQLHVGMRCLCCWSPCPGSESFCGCGRRARARYGTQLCTPRARPSASASLCDARDTAPSCQLALLQMCMPLTHARPRRRPRAQGQRDEARADAVSLDSLLCSSSSAHLGKTSVLSTPA